MINVGQKTRPLIVKSRSHAALAVSLRIAIELRQKLFKYIGDGKVTIRCFDTFPIRIL